MKGDEFPRCDMHNHGVRNLVILALVQVGVLVGAVLAAGATHKWYTTFAGGGNVPAMCRWVSDFGCFGLVLPIVWLCVAIPLARREDRSWVAAVIAGWVVLALLLLAGCLGAVLPWSRLVVSADSFD